MWIVCLAGNNVTYRLTFSKNWTKYLSTSLVVIRSLRVFIDNDFRWRLSVNLNYIKHPVYSFASLVARVHVQFNRIWLRFYFTVSSTKNLNVNRNRSEPDQTPSSVAQKMGVYIVCLGLLWRKLVLSWLSLNCLYIYSAGEIDKGIC